MKRVTFTYTCDFPDELPDWKCLESTIEIMEQDDNYAGDQFKIETVSERSES